MIHDHKETTFSLVKRSSGNEETVSIVQREESSQRDKSLYSLSANRTPCSQVEGVNEQLSDDIEDLQVNIICQETQQLTRDKNGVMRGSSLPNDNRSLERLKRTFRV